MDDYSVKLYARAYRDLDDIYTHIAKSLMEPSTAVRLIDELETAIFSLEQLPERGPIRRIGAYADSEYRHLFVKKYVIIYRVLKPQKEVHIITIRYAQAIFESNVNHNARQSIKRTAFFIYPNEEGSSTFQCFRTHRYHALFSPIRQLQQILHQVF